MCLPRPSNVEAAMALLQVLGLIIPVVFIALQPYYRGVAQSQQRSVPYPPNRAPDGGSRDQSDYAPPTEIIVEDGSPFVVKVGVAVVATLCFGAIVAGIEVMISYFHAPLVAWAAGLLVTGVIRISYLLYRVQRDFIKKIEVM